MKEIKYKCRATYIGLLISLIYIQFSSAQLFLDASGQLPDNGAKGPSMDLKAIDVDNDGDKDIILANEFQANTILLNDGQGIFTKAPSDALPQEIHDSEDIAIADFNMDGHQDIIFCSEDDINLGSTNVHEYYLGDGSGKFTHAEYSFPDSEANAVLAIDLNVDNIPDLIFGNNGFNRAYINIGDGTFEMDAPRLPEINRTTQDLNAADVDGDGDLDIFEGNENGNVLLLNDGTGHYSDASATHLPSGPDMETRKVTFGDADMDGDQDVFLSNVEFIQGKNRQNRLLINDGTGHYSDKTASQIPSDNDHTIDAIFEDVDLDSDPDIVVANVFGSPIKVYRNNSAGFFENATDDILGANYVRDALGVIAVDVNGDNLRDLYFCDRFMPQANRKDLLLLRSPVTSNHHTDANETEFMLFPNPIKNEFFIRSQKSIKAIRLENLQGQLIDTLKVTLQGNGLYSGEISHIRLTSGFYVFNVFELNKKVPVLIE